MRLQTPLPRPFRPNLLERFGSSLYGPRRPPLPRPQLVNLQDGRRGRWPFRYASRLLFEGLQSTFPHLENSGYGLSTDTIFARWMFRGSSGSRGIAMKTMKGEREADCCNRTYRFERVHSSGTLMWHGKRYGPHRPGRSPPGWPPPFIPIPASFSASSAGPAMPSDHFSFTNIAIINDTAITTANRAAHPDTSTLKWYIDSPAARDRQRSESDVDIPVPSAFCQTIYGIRILLLRQLNLNLLQPTLASLASSPSFAPTPPLLAASLWHSSPAPAPPRYSPPSAPNCARRDGFWYILRAASSLQERWSTFPAFGNSSDAQNRDLKCVKGEYEACVNREPSEPYVMGCKSAREHPDAGEWRDGKEKEWVIALLDGAFPNPFYASPPRTWSYTA
ncbi:hypothetical protein D9619_011197 [Psilocybe cf. subviscida]|uniref:Uncharacterized protein n=1 Tax=Psilocybe cf. subviscida TaxID=2480587 RepID=A0A8H5BLG7_9AGAR|nr:hypothetical protein D9619_011197 [Psilocybe cf. subviscida]